MSVHLVIPDSVALALRLPTVRRKQQLMVELALTLYANNNSSTYIFHLLYFRS